MYRKLLIIVPLVTLAMLGSILAVAAQHKAAQSGGPQLGNPGAASNPLTPVGGGFTYQGRLTSSGSPANGQYDLRFTLYDALTGGTQVGSSLTHSNQTVSDGLFTVTLDFGAGAFQGSARWIEIAVRTAGGPSFTALSPRQALTAAPYAVSLMPGAVISRMSLGLVGGGDVNEFSAGRVEEIWLPLLPELFKRCRRPRPWSNPAFRALWCRRGSRSTRPRARPGPWSTCCIPRSNAP